MIIQIGNIMLQDWHDADDSEYDGSKNVAWRQAVSFGDNCGYVKIRDLDNGSCRVIFSLVPAGKIYKEMYPTELKMSMSETKDFIDRFLMKMSKMSAFQ